MSLFTVHKSPNLAKKMQKKLAHGLVLNNHINNQRSKKMSNLLVQQSSNLVKDIIISTSDGILASFKKVDDIEWGNLTVNEIDNFLEIADSYSAFSELTKARMWMNIKEKKEWKEQGMTFEEYCRHQDVHFATIFRSIRWANLVLLFESSNWLGVSVNGNYVKIMPIKERWGRELLTAFEDNGKAFEVWKRVVRHARKLLEADNKEVTEFNLQKTINISLIRQEIARFKNSPKLVDIAGEFNKQNELFSEDYLDDNLAELTKQIQKEVEEEYNADLEKLLETLNSNKSEVERLTNERNTFLENQNKDLEDEIENSKKLIKKELSKYTAEMEALEQERKELELKTGNEVEKAKLEEKIKVIKANFAKKEKDQLDKIASFETKRKDNEEKLKELQDPEYRTKWIENKYKEKLELAKKQKEEDRIKAEVSRSIQRTKLAKEYMTRLDKVKKSVDSFVSYAKKNISLDNLSKLKTSHEGMCELMNTDRAILDGVLEDLERYVQTAFDDDIETFDTDYIYEDEEDDSTIDVNVA